MANLDTNISLHQHHYITQTLTHRDVLKSYYENTSLKKNTYIHAWIPWLLDFSQYFQLVVSDLLLHFLWYLWTIYIKTNARLDLAIKFIKAVPDPWCPVSIEKVYSTTWWTMINEIAEYLTMSKDTIQHVFRTRFSYLYQLLTCLTVQSNTWPICSFFVLVFVSTVSTNKNRCRVLRAVHANPRFIEVSCN